MEIFGAKNLSFCHTASLLNFLLLFLFLRVGAGGTDELEFQLWVENYIAKYTIPQGKSVGLGLVVVKNNNNSISNYFDNGRADPFYTGTFGYSDLEKELPVTRNTLHPIASITKGFVATLVVKVLSEKFPQHGEAVLEMPVKQLLRTNLNFFAVNWTLNDRYRTEQISFRDLLSHRSGLTGDITGAIFGAVQTTEEYIYRTRFEWELCPFRTEYIYNNAMYCLAGALIAQLAGQSFESLMKNFLIELGMTETRIGEMDLNYANMPNLMQPYYLDDSGVVQKGNANVLRQLSVVVPAAGIISTLNDMAKYLSFHMNAGSINGKQIIPPQVHAWLSKSSIAVSRDSTYGLGFELFVMKRGEAPLLDHGGYYPPYVANAYIYPDLGISIFSASNGPGGGTQRAANIHLHNAIVSYFMSKRTKTAFVPIDISPCKDDNFVNFVNFPFINPNPNQNINEHQEKSRKIFNNLLNVHDNKTRVGVNASVHELVGSFGAPVLGEMQISLKDETGQALKLTYGIWGEADLEPLHSSGHLYKIKWNSEMVMYFSSQADGNIVENILEFEDNDKLLWYSMGGLSRRFWRNRNLKYWSEVLLPVSESCQG